MICHNKYKAQGIIKGTGFTRPFDFAEYFKKLPYYENYKGKQKLSSKRVRDFIANYLDYCHKEGVDEFDSSSMEAYVKENYVFEDGQEKKFKDVLNLQWPRIVERIQIVDKIDEVCQRSYVAIIDVKNPSPSDSQKIFNIINTGGEKLSSVEVLSAKPHWNIKVTNPSETALMAKNKLYKRIGVESLDTVRWDYPATFYRRLGNNVVFPELEENEDNLGKELTYGFKILSAIKIGGVKKDNIEELGRRSDINWATDIDALLEEISYMFKVITTFPYFKFLESWRITIRDLSSEAAAINFFTLVYLDWLRKGKPVGGDVKTKQFQKNCFILWDQTIYEYVYKQWKGAADQKTAKNIADLPQKPEVFEPIAKEKWQTLLKEIFEESTIDGLDITKDYMSPILYHMYCLREISGPATTDSIEVDHIIPQSLFNTSTIKRKETIQHNVLNMGLLPKRENISKSNNKLKMIDNAWLKNQIVMYEFIKEADFAKYSDINNYLEMFDERKAYFEEAFGQLRDGILNN